MVKKILLTILTYFLLPFFGFLSGVNPHETAYNPIKSSEINFKEQTLNNQDYGKMEIYTHSQIHDFNSKKIMVISDVHIMSDKLLKADGTAFQEYLQKDRKLLQESIAIAEELSKIIITENPELVLVSGDLTKDGELLGHQKFVEIFQPVVDSGIKMLVIPGNHDVNNPDAVYFNGDKTEYAETVSTADFARIYDEFGYGDAISRDQNSLSYVSEPIQGLRVIAIDGCRYYDNQFKSQGAEKDVCVTNGIIKPETMAWIKEQASIARMKGKNIISMVHHNVVEHFDFQGEISAPYLLENIKEVQRDFMEAGIQVVFTGHFHANDIAKTYNANGNYLYDVETGSPVTYPCPYRIVEYGNDNQLNITTKRIESIDYDLNGESFQAYAKRLIEDNIPEVLSGLIKMYYSEVKQYTKPYSAFIKIPGAEELGQLMEDNFGEIEVRVMMKIYEGNNSGLHDTITLKQLNDNIDNVAGKLARTPLLKRRIAKSLHDLEYVKKIKLAVNNIMHDVKNADFSLPLSIEPNIAQLNINEKIDDLNYLIMLQQPEKIISQDVSIQFFPETLPLQINELAEQPDFRIDNRWTNRTVVEMHP